MSLLMAVERHLRRAAIAPSRFGREVIGDPRFVFDLRRGRQPRASTHRRVIAAIESAKTCGSTVSAAMSRDFA